MAKQTERNECCNFCLAHDYNSCGNADCDCHAPLDEMTMPKRNYHEDKRGVFHCDTCYAPDRIPYYCFSDLNCSCHPDKTLAKAMPAPEPMVTDKWGEDHCHACYAPERPSFCNNALCDCHVQPVPMPEPEPFIAHCSDCWCTEFEACGVPTCVCHGGVNAVTAARRKAELTQRNLNAAMKSVADWVLAAEPEVLPVYLRQLRINLLHQNNMHIKALHELTLAVHNAEAREDG